MKTQLQRDYRETFKWIKLHLNKRGTTILSNDFTGAISNSIQWQFIFHGLNN